MNAYPHLAFVYLNGAKPPLPESRRVIKLEYRSSSLDNEGKIQFTNFELKTNEDLQVMWSIFYRYASKGLIEVDTKIERPTNDIVNMLQHPELPVYNNM